MELVYDDLLLFNNLMDIRTKNEEIVNIDVKKHL
jgi:hypothetical protein